MPNSLRMEATSGVGANRCSIDAIRNHGYPFARHAEVFRQELTVRIGDGNEGVGDRRQDAIETADAIWPTGAVECGEDDGDADPAGRQATPEHFVACADRDDGVDLASRRRCVSRGQTAQIVFVRQKVVVHRDFAGERLRPTRRVLSSSRVPAQIRSRFRRRMMLAVSISAPPTRMSVCMNMTAQRADATYRRWAIVAVEGVFVIQSHGEAPFVRRLATNRSSNGGRTS